MKKTKTTEAKLLTETELELMTILWKLGEGSVADVIALLPKERALAYTSVSTILRILEQKEILTTRKALPEAIAIMRLTPGIGLCCSNGFGGCAIRNLLLNFVYGREKLYHCLFCSNRSFSF